MGKLTVFGPSERARFDHIYSTYVKMETVAACEALWALLTRDNGHFPEFQWRP
jgi:hypothetical protein